MKDIGPYTVIAIGIMGIVIISCTALLMGLDGTILLTAGTLINGLLIAAGIKHVKTKEKKEIHRWEFKKAH